MIKKKFSLFFITLLIINLSLTGCALFENTVNELRGDIVGNTYTIDTFDNFGKNVMQIHGQKINVQSNIVKERTYTSDGWGYVKTMSSVITINIDGHQLSSCGDTMIFYEDGLVPDVNFEEENIFSTADSFGDNTIISGIVNKYKNYFGKPVVVVIKSQTGYPLYAFSGKSVYWDIPDNLPKFTKFTIDGKQLYIHRANFQIIDVELIT